MDDAFAVSRLQPAQHLAHDVDGFRNRQLALFFEDLIKALSFYILHRDELDAGSLAEIEDANHVAVGDLPGEYEFLLETLENFGITGEFRPDDFEGNDAVEFEVFGLVYGTHAAFAENLQNLVAVSDDHSRRKNGGPEGAGWRRC